MSSAHRRGYIDWARGVAVLLMIEAHTVDAWTRPVSKNTVAFRNATILGGFAAPFFLWLAGVALVLSATRTMEKTGSMRAAVDAVCRRGLEIFILAFLFRLQAFVLSPGGPAIALFRVDILNVMGPAIVFAAIAWGAARSTRAQAVTLAALAIAIAMSTPIVRTAGWISSLPTWVQWYLRPAGEYTTFTAFPWAGFVFAGAASGALITAVRDVRSELRLHAWFAACGTALVAVGFVTASLPTIYRESYFWTSSPTWFAIRTGLMMLALSSLFAIETIAARPSLPRVLLSWQAPLATLGRHSLFVYWIHVELVYGYASWLWRGRLPLWGTLAAYAAFSTLVYAAVVLIGVKSRVRVRPQPGREEVA